MAEDRAGKDRVYTKWKPPKNKLTQEIQRRKSGKRKSVVADTAVERERSTKVDTAMTAVSAGPGKSASQIYFYDWSDNYRRVIKELKAAEADRLRSESVSSLSSLDSCKCLVSSVSVPSCVLTASKVKMNRKFGVSKRPSVISGSEKVKSQEKSPPKKELQKSTPKIAKEYIDTRWPKVKIFYAMKSFI